MKDACNRESKWLGTSAALLVAIAIGVPHTLATTLPPSQETSLSDRLDRMDSRWLAWIGCWSLVGTDTERANKQHDGLSDAPEPSIDEAVVCLGPTDDPETVRLVTELEDDERVEQALIADGGRHSVEDQGCVGWQHNRWSEDGRRLYVSSELTCGDEATVEISGITMMVRGQHWLDAQVFSSGEYRELVVRRFRPVDTGTTRQAGLDIPDNATDRVHRARRANIGPFSLDEVIEATALTRPEVVEAVLLDSPAQPHVDAATLHRLADAGVTPSVIDLLVALSFPDLFEIDRFGAPDALEGEAGGGGILWEQDGQRYRYARMAAVYYYAPFGSYYWRNPYYRQRSFSGRSVVSQELSRGRVVKGRGYTRVRSRGPTRDAHRVRRRGQHADASSSGSSSGSSGSSGSSVGSSGFRSGGGSSGRTAKPRKPPRDDPASPTRILGAGRSVEPGRASIVDASARGRRDAPSGAHPPTRQ